MNSDSSAKHIQAILWDLDGTLVQSEGHHRELESGLLEWAGAGEHAPLLDQMVGLRTEDVLAKLLAEAGKVDQLPAVMERRERLLSEQVINRALPIRGIEQVLNDIPMRTHRFALVTSSERKIAAGILERFGWAWRFELLVCGDDVAQPKPAPEPFALACERLGLAPERTLAVEDSVPGVRSARSAGCVVAAVVGTHSVEDLNEAHYVLSNVGALPGLLSVLK